MASADSSSSGLFGAKRNVNLSKWNFLFDTQPTEWISFKPELDLFVYPCYTCRNMFSSKNSFLDHVNRRTVILNYNCPDCDEALTFYNGCAFLLHARKHFSLKEGKIDLSKLEIFVLPIGMAGFPPNPHNIPMIYTEDEDVVESNVYVNSQFYSANNTMAGKQIICFRPRDLVFTNRSDNGCGIKLAMKQICTTLPKCQFVELEGYQRLKKLHILLEENESLADDAFVSTKNVTREAEITIKTEPEENTFTMPVISKIESLHKEAIISGEVYPKCSECEEIVKIPMAQHFLNENLPFNISLNCGSCRFTAPTKCSLLAHTRIHTGTKPFVCPECGKTFDTMKVFQQHLDDVCFHLSKQVKFRCPGKRCGKLFSLTTTYVSHFENHLRLYYECRECKAAFLELPEAREHCFKNPNVCTLRRIFDCGVCNLSPKDLGHMTYKQHILWHTSDRSRCMYVYVCRSCRASFRSTNTYAIHQLKCAKLIKKIDRDNNKQHCVDCKNCRWKIVYIPNELAKECRNCLTLNYLPQDPIRHNENAIRPWQEVNDISEENGSSEELCFINKTNEKEVCILCNVTMQSGAKIAHLEACKYSNPTVILTRYTDEEFEQLQFSQLTSSSSEVDSLENSPNTENDSSKSTSPSKPEESARKRRKRLAFSNRHKKPNLVNIHLEDLQAEKPTPFTGTYRCKLCDFCSTVRDDFHGHIMQHRDILTAHQCMECGECFVVKPSLVKHLQHFHFINDIEHYFEENDCYDKMAVKELQKALKNPIGENKTTDKNQCRVCMQKFTNSVELNKHFRVHGMAFLMSNSK